MVRVEEAEQIIQMQVRDYGSEIVALEATTGRVLAEPIVADRDLPPYNRTTMDGIAVSYQAFENGTHTFQIKAVQAAGDDPVEISQPDECIEIMTGSVLPASTDTIIPYEDILIENKLAAIRVASVIKGQNIHYKGKDNKQYDTLVSANQLMNPSITAIAASTGKATLSVKKLPKTVIVSTGNELTGVDEIPSAYQVRRSNNYMMKAVLQQYRLEADMLHIPDDLETIKQQLKNCLVDYDVVILSGGISMGKFDYVPQALKELSVKELFYKVQQRPGKPFWFGTYVSGALVFAFPGNPVSTFLCLHRYLLPWLKTTLGVQADLPFNAVLDADMTFHPPLQYFLQVKLRADEKGQLVASPVEGNGSGDFSNLLNSNAFMEFPSEQCSFRKGDLYKVWPFKQVFL